MSPLLMSHQNKLHITRRSIFAALNNGRHLPRHLFVARHMQLEERAISPRDGSGDSGLRSAAGLCVSEQEVGWPLGPSDAHANGWGVGRRRCKNDFASEEIWKYGKYKSNLLSQIIIIYNYLSATKGGALEVNVRDFAATNQEFRVWFSPFHPRELNLLGLKQAVDSCAIQPRFRQTKKTKTQPPRAYLISPPSLLC